MDWSEKQFPLLWQLGRPRTFSPCLLPGLSQAGGWAEAGKKELAEINLPTSEAWLRAEETSWPQDSEQGGWCPTARPWGARPEGTFMFRMPNSVSVNTMCFLFHAGVGVLIVQHFLRGPNVSRAQGEVACAESSLLKATETGFGAKGPTSEVGILHPNLGRAPQASCRGGACGLACDFLHMGGLW